MTKRNVKSKSTNSPANVREDLRAQFPLEESLFSVGEASCMLQLGRSYTYMLIAAGKLKTVNVGRRRLVPGKAIQKFIRTLNASAESR